MKDKFFDHIIKNKLDAMKSPDSGRSWDLLQQKMDIADLEEDLLLDKTISDQIQGYEVPFNPSHWARLKAKLEMESYLKSRIYIAKVAEVTMLFLLLFTLHNIYPINQEWFDGETEVYADGTLHQFSSPKNSLDKPIVYPDTQIEIQEEAGLIPEAINVRNPIRPVSRLNTVSQNHLQRREISKINSLMAELPSTHSGIDIPHQNIGIVVSADPEQNGLEKIALLEIESLKKERNMVYGRDFAPVQSATNHEVPHKWNLGLSADINLINVPWDKVYSIPGYNLKETSLSGYAGVDFALNRDLILQAGIRYKRTSYEPKEVRERYGSQNEFYKETYLDKITYDIISIPIALNLSLFQGGGWNTYVSVGGAMNIITKSDYVITETLRSDSSRPNAYPSREPRLQEKDFIPGLSEGGDLAENLYATASFGFGAQKRIRKGLEIYMQPTYYHHILNDAVGPNEDKLNSMSMKVGVLMDIN